MFLNIYSKLKEAIVISDRIRQVTSKSFTINDLKPNTTYQLKIRQNYMNIQQGNYTVYNFTTKITGIYFSFMNKLGSFIAKLKINIGLFGNFIKM